MGEWCGCVKNEAVIYSYVALIIIEIISPVNFLQYFLHYSSDCLFYRRERDHHHSTITVIYFIKTRKRRRFRFTVTFLRKTVFKNLLMHVFLNYFHHDVFLRSY